jgi:transcriptional regulator with XRE-family HTH domain
MTDDNQLPELLRSARLNAGLSQRTLAARSGVPEKRISSYERGARQPPLPAANSVLAALGLQLVLSTEPLDADLDRQIDEFEGVPLSKRLTRMRPRLTEIHDADPWVDGPAAAPLLGVPVRVDRVDLCVLETNFDVLAKEFARRRPIRWSDVLGEWSLLAHGDPREPGSIRWSTHLGEMRIKACEQLPESVSIRLSDEYSETDIDVRVVALTSLGIVDKEAARLVDRVIERSRASPVKRDAAA